ncbi:protein O-mannosyl-transferase family [Actinomycetota bacterium]
MPSASADAAWTRHTDTDWIAAGAAALAAFVLYVLTAARYPVTGDNPDFLTAAHELGVPHAPGYPIAVVLGHLTGWVPGPEAFGLNLAAVLMGALTVFLLTLTARLLGAHPWVAAAGALVFAVNPLVWEYFLQLEAFPFAMASVAATVYFLVRWKLDPRRLWPLYAAAVCFGLGLVAHQNIALLVPAILYLGWTERRRTGKHEWLYTKGIAFVLVSWLLPYLFVVWASGREPVMNWGRPDSIGRLWPVIRREGYTDVTFGGSGLGTAPERLWWFVSSFGVAGLLIIAGLVWAWRHRGWWARFALVGVATWAVALMLLNGAISTYGYFVLSRFFLQFHVLLAPAIALGLQWLLETIRDRRPALAGRAAWLAAGAGLLAALVLGAFAFPHTSLAGNDVAARHGRDVLGGTSINGTDDTSLEGSYYAPRGLGSDVVKQDVDLNLLDVAKQNAALFDGFEPPTRAEIRPRTVSFEPVILETYTAAMNSMGEQLLKANQKAPAAEWYQRTLEIDPTNAAATRGLAATR